MPSVQQTWLLKTSQSLLQAPAKHGDVSANYAAILTRFLQEKGLDSSQILAQAGIDPDILDNSAAWISTQQYADLIQACLTMTDNPAIGLEYGQRLNISTHGLLGYAVMSSPSLEKAAELAMKYIQIRNQLIHIDFQILDKGTESDAEAAICFDVPLSAPDLYRFEIETSISSLFGIWRELLGNSEGVTAVHFSYPEPDKLQPYKQLFDVPVVFSQPNNAMCFSPAAFDRLARITDPTLTRIAEQQCESLLQQQEVVESGHQQELGASIRTLLLKSPGEFLNQQQIAEKLGITPRTLSRRLKRENLTFKSIIDDVRKQLALQCLTSTQWSIDEIAYMLNYSDAANFRRAVKRWTNLTPKQYRLSES